MTTLSQRQRQVQAVLDNPGTNSLRIIRHLETADLSKHAPEHAARALNVSYWQMCQLLKKEGTKWSVLLWAERRRRLNKMLQADPWLSLHAMGKELGMTEGSVKVYFRGFMGCTLREWRSAGSDCKVGSRGRVG